jgi:hypothetical protein
MLMQLQRAWPLPLLAFSRPPHVHAKVVLMKLWNQVFQDGGAYALSCASKVETVVM